MSWIGTDLNLLKSDAEQFRRHMDWLLEDLRTHRASLDGQAEALDVLMGELDGCMERLGRFEVLLTDVRQATDQRAA